MESRLLKYYNRCLVEEDILRYNKGSVGSIGQVKKVLIGISLNNIKSEEDRRILDSIRLLESLVGKKVGIVKLESGYRYNKKVYTFSCKITLRGDEVYMFLDYLSTVVLPIYVRRYGWLKRKVGKKGVFNLVLRDLNIFFNFREEMVNFQDRINVSIVMGGDIKGSSRNLIEGLKLPVKDE